MESKKSVSIIGSGSWSTALVKIILNNVDKITWWIREPEIIENLLAYNHNHMYLSSVEFETEQLILTNDINQAVENADIIILCVPAAFINVTLEGLSKESFKDKIVVSAIKGIIPESNEIIADFLESKFEVAKEYIVIVSGPSHAEEVALEKLTYLTVASIVKDNALEVSSYLNCRYIRTSTTDDIYGTEYAPILKNIIAIAAGISNALGYGDNFQAVLVSNAIQEINRFLEAVHPINRDINSSVYLGDLLVTTYSQFSRNRMFGNMIGKGYSVKFVQMEMKMIAEGYFAVKGIKSINSKYNVDMPIVDAVFNILYTGKAPISEFRKLIEKLS